MVQVGLLIAVPRPDASSRNELACPSSIASGTTARRAVSARIRFQLSGANALGTGLRRLSAVPGRWVISSRLLPRPAHQAASPSSLATPPSTWENRCLGPLCSP